LTSGALFHLLTAQARVRLRKKKEKEEKGQLGAVRGGHASIVKKEEGEGTPDGVWFGAGPP